jgi:hypothetical protein
MCAVVVVMGYKYPLNPISPNPKSSHITICLSMISMLSVLSVHPTILTFLNQSLCNFFSTKFCNFF